MPRNLTPEYRLAEAVHDYLSALDELTLNPTDLETRATVTTALRELRRLFDLWIDSKGENYVHRNKQDR
jgi:hypothetical protein